MNANDRAKLVRAALIAADDLEQRHHYPAVGVFRQLCRIVATLPDADEVPRCAGPGCGQPLTSSARGRPRTYCSTRCKTRASKQRQRKVVEMTYWQ